MSDLGDRPPLDEAERMRRIEEFAENLRAKIAAQGHQVMGIFDPDDPEAGLFMYTVGLTERGRPELVVTDVPIEVRQFATHVLNSVAELSFTEPLVVNEIVKVEVADREYYFRVHEVEPSDPRFRFGLALHLYGEAVRGLLLDPVDDSGEPYSAKG